MMNGPKLEHEHEQRLAATRDHWMTERDNIERELNYARRTVEALSTLLAGFDNAVISTQPKETLAAVSGRLDGRNSDKYPVNKSYEVGSGERY